MVKRLTRLASRPVALSLAVAVLLGGAGTALFVAQRNARDGLTERLYERVAPIDHFLDVAVTETMRGRAFAAGKFAQRPSDAAVQAVNDNVNGGGGRFVLFDARGRIAATSAPSPALRADAERLLARSPAGRAALREALGGKPCTAIICGGYVISELLGVARGGDATVNRPSVGFFVPFTGAGGRRYVLADISTVDEFQQILGSLFAGAGAVRGSHAYLVTAAGRVLAQDREAPDALGRMAADGAVLRAIAHGDRGAYRSTSGDAHFVAQPVRNSGLHLVLTAPDSRLYASVSGPSRWVPWTLLLALVAASGAALLALRASDRRGEALAAASAAKTQFLASASHELRTPLNGIIGFSQLLHDGKLGELDAVQREATKDILTSAEHLNRLVGSLLDITRAETGRLEINPEAVVLPALVADVRAGLQAVADDKGIAMATRIDEDLPEHVVVDPTRLRQVLLNFLSNALKFTPAGGQVSIEVTPERDAAFRIAVRDTGPGLSDEAMARLFRRYERLRTTMAEGTGLGLAVTREIVEAHGGRTGVESTLGEGATFFAIFPLEVAAERVRAAS